MKSKDRPAPSLLISEIQELVGKLWAVQLTNLGETDSHQGLLATILHVEPVRGRVRLCLGPYWYSTFQCCQEHIKLADATGKHVTDYRDIDNIGREADDYEKEASIKRIGVEAYYTRAIGLRRSDARR